MKMKMFVLILLTIFSNYCYCLIQNLIIQNDYRNIFEIESFGFLVGGKLNITIYDFTINHLIHKENISYKVGFMLRPSKNQIDDMKDFDQSSQKSCIFDDIHLNDIILDLSNPSDWKKTSRSFIISSHAAGLYSFIFARCKPQNPQITINFKINAIFVNPGPNYLSAGDAPLPKMYMFFFIIYSIVLIIWYRIIFKQPIERRNFLHFLMAGVLSLKCFTLLFESIRYHYISINGSSEGWSIIYYIFSSLKGVMLFLVIVLIGSGWTLVKPFLASREKNIILAVLCLQILNNIAIIILEETSPGSIGWFNWNDILHLVDILCCIAVLYPIFWSIHHFRQAAEVDGKARDNLVKLQLFRQFYVLVLCYIYFTRVIVYLLIATVIYIYLYIYIFNFLIFYIKFYFIGTILFTMVRTIFS